MGARRRDCTSPAARPENAGAARVLAGHASPEGWAVGLASARQPDEHPHELDHAPRRRPASETSHDVGCLAAMSLKDTPRPGSFQGGRECAAMIVKRSAFPVRETVERLVGTIERRELTLFGRIDHAAGAREVGQSSQTSACIGS